MNTNLLRLLRLLHLVSPTLPIGAFTYSQGIEWAVEEGWIRSPEQLHEWVLYQLQTTVSLLEVPLLMRCYQAVQERDREKLQYWIDFLQASRESHELLLEEKQRGRALTDLLIAWQIEPAAAWKAQLAQSQLAAFAVATCYWQIPITEAAQAYCWGWLENSVLAAIKLIPLGQTAGQCLLQKLIPQIPPSVEIGLQLADTEIGASSPALAIASSCHEIQYTRLFRS